MRIYYDGVRIYDSGYTNGAMTVVVPYGPGVSNDVTIVMNEGGGTPGTVWDYTATITPASTVQDVVMAGDFLNVNGKPRTWTMLTYDTPEGEFKSSWDDLETKLKATGANVVAHAVFEKSE